MNASGLQHDDALESFLEKWRTRWPEWNVVQVFVPAQQRELALAWAALQQELTDAAWGGSDARPGEAKLAWWMEELQGWSRGLRRHPLGSALQRQAAPWQALGAAIPSLRESRERPRDRDDALHALLPFARAVAAVDSSLFGGTAETGVHAVQASLLQVRLAQLGEAGVPLSALAGKDGATRTWSQELLMHWPSSDGAPRPRRLWTALARHRLRRGDPGLPLPPWTALMAAWRGARG